TALSNDLHPSGSARRLTNEGGSNTHPVWAKDGSRIFYRSESVLRVVNVVSPDAPQAILSQTANIAELSLERDLVYSQTQSDTNIWRAEIPARNSPPTSPHLLIGSTRGDQAAQYSPNGKAIAFRSSR